MDDREKSGSRLQRGTPTRHKDISSAHHGLEISSILHTHNNIGKDRGVRNREMGDSGTARPDINVSNGTCYYTEHKETRGDFIACGNVAFGHWPCCQAGDMCLSLGNVNGCWDSDTGNTYLAGCTDPGFNARACPWKPPLFHEQEWVAIQQCRAGGGDDGTVWGGCKVEANQTTLEKLPHASCDPYCSVTVVQDASVLPAFASLPGSAGGSIKWTSGFEPTATAKGVRPAASASPTGEGSGTATGTVAPGSSVTTPPDATATSPPPAATSSADNGGLTVGAKAGIGVGAAGAALLIVAVVLLGLLVRRRRQRRDSQGHLAADTTTSAHHPRQYDEAPEQQQQQRQEQVMYYNNVYYNKTSPPPPVTAVVQPYVGYKAELSADEAQQKQAGFQSELAADETTRPRNEIGSSGGHDDVGGSRAGSRRGSGGAHMTPGVGGGGAGGGNGLSPHPSPHPSSAATAHSPFSAYSEVSTLCASSGGSGGGGGTGRWAPAPPTPPQQHQQQQQRHREHPPEHERPLPSGHGGSGGMQSFRERQQGRGGTWRSHGYDPS